MNAHRRQPMVIALVAIMALAQWGCALKRIGGPSLDEIRTQVAVVGVTSPSATPNAELGTPTSGRGAAAAKGATVGAIGGATPGAVILQGLRGCNGGGSVGAMVCGTVAVVGLGLAAAGGTIGAVGGALYGVASTEPPSKEVGAALKSVAGEQNLQEALRESLLQAGPRQTSLTFVPVEPWVQADSKLGLGRPPAADTIVEVAVKTIRLTREGPGANPPVALESTARARLIRASDGRELYRHATNRRSASRPYEAWAADNGQHLKDALAEASVGMAEEIIDVFFVRSPTVPKMQEPPQPVTPTATATVNVQSEVARSWRPAPSTAEAAKQNACRREYLHGWGDWRDRLPQYRACLER